MFGMTKKQRLGAAASLFYSAVKNIGDRWGLEE
jgi:hypothetical protein